MPSLPLHSLVDADARFFFCCRRPNPFRTKIRVRVGCGYGIGLVLGRRLVDGRLTPVALAVVVSGAEDILSRSIGMRLLGIRV